MILGIKAFIIRTDPVQKLGILQIEMHGKKVRASGMTDLKIMHLHRRDNDEIACVLLIFS
ncbi:hypothetical protein D3C73_1673560 [compost metagenome]